MKNVSTFGRNEYVRKQGTADRADRAYKGHHGKSAVQLQWAHIRAPQNRTELRDNNKKPHKLIKKMAVFLWSKGRFLAVFHQIWTSEGPNVVKIPNTRVSDPFPVTFPGGKFWYHDKKKLAHFWARREARFAICPFFLRKNIFSARLVF